MEGVVSLKFSGESGKLKLWWYFWTLKTSISTCFKLCKYLWKPNIQTNWYYCDLSAKKL